MPVSRRRWLGQAAGAVALILGLDAVRSALGAQIVPHGAVRVRGEVRLNGEPMRPGTMMRSGDVIESGPRAELLAVTGTDAFLLRGGSRLELAAVAARGLALLRLVSGAMLCVFGAGVSPRIETPAAAIGIRGTGLYLESEAVRTYVCTCYGSAELVPIDAPHAAETVHTTYHDEPRYIYRAGAPRYIERAPVINHTDSELVLLEGIVGRKPPFVPGAY